MSGQQRSDKKGRKTSEAAVKTRASSTCINEGAEDIAIEEQTPSKNRLPETQATITSLFKSDTAGDKEDPRRNTDTILKSLEAKMNKLVTVEHLQKEFKKMITTEFLSSKLEALKAELKEHFDKELEKIYSRIKSLERERDSAKDETITIKNNISDMESKLHAIQDQNEKIKSENQKLTEKIDNLQGLFKSQEIQFNDLEQYTRRNNIRIYGLDDRKKDETAQETMYVVLNFLRDKLGISLKPCDIDIAHRIGRYQDNGNRIVICRFASRLTRNAVMKKRSELKGSVWVIKDDLTRKNAKLLEKVSEVRNVKSAWSDNGKIIALLENEGTNKKETVVVTLKTDVSKPLEVRKQQEPSILVDRD